MAAVLLGGVSIFGGRGALHGVIAGVVLIGVLASALRLANITSDIINIITGRASRASVVSRPAFPGRVQKSAPAARQAFERNPYSTKGNSMTSATKLRIAAAIAAVGLTLATGLRRRRGAAASDGGGSAPARTPTGHHLPAQEPR